MGEWNYGRSPAFAINRETGFAGGTIETWLDVSKGGVINQVCFHGDFFGQRDVSELEASLQEPYTNLLQYKMCLQE